MAPSSATRRVVGCGRPHERRRRERRAWHRTPRWVARRGGTRALLALPRVACGEQRAAAAEGGRALALFSLFSDAGHQRVSRPVLVRAGVAPATGRAPRPWATRVERMARHGAAAGTHDGSFGMKALAQHTGVVAPQVGVSWGGRGAGGFEGRAWAAWLGRAGAEQLQDGEGSCSPASPHQNSASSKSPPCKNQPMENTWTRFGL